MTTLKGPGIFLAQFLGDEAPFNSLESICKWSKELGFAGVQVEDMVRVTRDGAESLMTLPTGLRVV